MRTAWIWLALYLKLPLLDSRHHNGHGKILYKLKYLNAIRDRLRLINGGDLTPLQTIINLSGVTLTERSHVNIMFVLSGPHLMIEMRYFKRLSIFCCVGELCCFVPENPPIWRPKCPQNVSKNGLEKIMATLIKHW